MARRPTFFRRHAKKLIFLVIVSGVVGVVLSRRFAPKPVTVTPIERGIVVDAVYATGSVEAEDRMVVKAKTSGSLAEIVVREGTSVKKGDLLARIDNPGATFELKRGQSDLSAASKQAGTAPHIASLAAQIKALEADRELAKRNLTRVTELTGSGALPRADLEIADTRVRQIEAQIGAIHAQQQATRIDLNANRDRQAAMVESLQARVADTEVRAPQDGVVLAKLVELGEVVTVNQPLFRIGDTRSLVLEVMVDEADVAKVSDGVGKAPSVVAISLYAYPKQTFGGVVFEILPEANRERKAFLAKIRFDTPPVDLRSGMTAEVNVITGRKEDVLLAPGEAEEEGHVWVIDGGRARRRAVGIGTRDLLRFEATSGLAEGELVVVEGQKGITEGARVTTTTRVLEKLAPVPDETQPAAVLK